MDVQPQESKINRSMIINSVIFLTILGLIIGLVVSNNNINNCNTNLTNSDNLKIACNKNLSTCNTNKANCDANLNTCTNDRRTCESNLSTCNTDKSICNTNLNTCNTDKTICNTNLNTCNTDKTKYASDLLKKEYDYNEIAKRNLELANVVKNDIRFRSYAGCIGNIYNLPFYRAFQGDDSGQNSTRAYYCTPYYTNGSASDSSQDYRKPVFK